MILKCQPTRSRKGEEYSWVDKEKGKQIEIPDGYVVTGVEITCPRKLSTVCPTATVLMEREGHKPLNLTLRFDELSYLPTGMKISLAH